MVPKPTLHGVHNVRANPNVHVEIGAESYDAVARELSGDERDSVLASFAVQCPGNRGFRHPGHSMI